MLFNQIRNFVRQFATKNAEIISRLNTATKMASLAAISIAIPLTVAKPQPYQTAIEFSPTSANPLVMESNEVVVVSVPSRAEIDNGVRDLNPDTIKELMQELAPEYGIDWKLVYAIGYHESGNYQSALARNNFNFFGRKATSNTYAKWNDPVTAIQNEFQYLQDNYFSRGLNTPAKINPVYAEDPSWHYAVESIMNTL